MRKYSVLVLVIIFVLITFSFFFCENREITEEEKNANQYTSFSRFTDPREYAFMLKEIPDNELGICKIAQQQSVHHNLLPHFEIPENDWENMNRVWPPYMYDQLKVLKDTRPFNLFDDRPIKNRIVGACMSESHFLAGMLRYKKISVRLRAGYFKDTLINIDHFIDFWMKVARAKGWARGLLNDPEKWNKSIGDFLNQQIAANHYIEHWVCEYWDREGKMWQILDANTDFLKVSAGIDVGFYLPGKHFEYAFEAWKKMRNNENFNPDQYLEDPQDGRSHIRSQLLWDFYSLLNHDIAGFSTPKRSTYKFVKQKKFKETSADELKELDNLAELLSKNPSVAELVSFYRNSKTLKLEAAELDPYSFVFRNK